MPCLLITSTSSSSAYLYLTELLLQPTSHTSLLAHSPTSSSHARAISVLLSSTCVLGFRTSFMWNTRILIWSFKLLYQIRKLPVCETPYNIMESNLLQEKLEFCHLNWLWCCRRLHPMVSTYPVSSDTILSVSSNNIRNENQEKFHCDVGLCIRNLVVVYLPILI